MSPRPDSEEALERATIQLFRHLGWDAANCFDEVFGSTPASPRHPHLGRETTSDVVLIPHLRDAIEKLNPQLSTEAITLAIEELTRDRSLLSAAHANRELYRLLKDGVKVNVRGVDGDTVETVRVIDWHTPANNNFFLASQLWISGEMYKRRADLVGFVNGLPLVFIELKTSHRQLKAAYDDNLRDYRNTVPQIFWHNAFIILSNGSESLIGSLTAQWEHFATWKKINDEGEAGIISLETIIRGTCQPDRLLDLVENFILYNESEGNLAKLIAKNHQYLGVNNAITAVNQLKENRGRLGVFWHTQGSGKSYSMVFFAQKILRTLPGNWTFLIVTDRDDLDDQIYKNFADVGAVTEPEERVRAESGESLKQLLSEDHRYTFTLIQKFHTRGSGAYPKLSDRSDIIVIADEAHRSQYDTFALNMRNALPNAAFIGFTGTPLMAGEEKTREVFGKYVSIYNFAQSVADRATVPLYYENRIPELQLVNPDLNADMSRVIEDAALDEEQEKKLEREFAHDYHLITRDERLEKIAADLAAHFMGREQRGKAMVVSLDKATAVKMYDKVQKHWQIHLATLQADIESCADDSERAALRAQLDYMRETDMAVVVSQSQNEVEDLQKKGADIAPHRKRMVAEDLETKFKDAKDPFRIVFVCAMWMTGFDAPACSTIYLDKPMRNHTLMQTIARANRVFGDKVNGLIVDYIGVFRDLQKALAIYGSASGGGVAEGDLPVKEKSALIGDLRTAISDVLDFYRERGVDIAPILNSEGFQRVRYVDDAARLLVDAKVNEAVEDSVDKIILNDELKKRYLLMANDVARLYRAILPDRRANEFYATQSVIKVIAEKILSFTEPPNISRVMQAVDTVLDKSVAAEGYVIKGATPNKMRDAAPNTDWVDLSQIDFEALKRRFAQSRKRIEIEKLRAAIQHKLDRMVQLNRTRMNFYEQFQRMIAEYNAGATDVDTQFAKLMAFIDSLNEEEKRGLPENLDEEQLVIFDLLTKPNLKLTKREETQVKKVARDLLDALKAERLVLDWRKKQQTRAAVQICIEQMLDKLPSRYDKPLYEQKCSAVFQHVYESYYGAGRSVYQFTV